jgi:hypothetical protein
VDSLPATEPLEVVAGLRLLRRQGGGVALAVSEARGDCVVALPGAGPGIEAPEHHIAQASIRREHGLLVEELDRGAAPACDLAAVRGFEAGQDAPQRALATAIAAHQPYAFLSAQREVDPPEHASRSVGLLEPAGIDHRHGGRLAGGDTLGVAGWPRTASWVTLRAG